MSQRTGPFHPVAEGVYVATVSFPSEAGSFPSEAGPAEVTVGLVVGADAALLVDTGSTPEQGRRLRAAVAAVTPLALSTVVLTHWHYDHSFGLSGLDAATSIAHESVPDRLAGATPARLGIASGTLAPPTKTIAVAAAIDLGGGVRVEAVHLGRGHTDGDLVVVVPGADVVFAGDLVESSGPPQYGPDSFPHEWPATLDGLIGLTTGTTRILPGHGPAMDRVALFEQRSRIGAVSAEITRLAGLGVDEADAESRGDWALPFAAIRAGYRAGCAQARAASPQRHLPLV